MCQRSLQESTDISTSCRTTASGTPRAREHVAYGVASSLESQTCSSQIWISATRCSSMVGYAAKAGAGGGGSKLSIFARQADS
jgi:hypothetical protein